ncbi:MAG: alpha/beta hydrolase [Deltaproteobacteria bacterium]|nr:alpha/beta hydrolase [Deltaproteobacteria bacterium]MBK8695241.1 alpha/beta hydrolase [Deltaproteobacteria bacterium]MBP6830355.1 alpha/beta hydrolase [Deltaproteobacteria bacterium]
MIAFTGPVIGSKPSSKALQYPSQGSAGPVGPRREVVGRPRGIVDDLATEHAKLRAPVLFVWGEDDVTFPIDLARTMVGQIPDCRGLRAVPGASLLVHEEKPDAVAEHALAFYREFGVIDGGSV